MKALISVECNLSLGDESPNWVNISYWACEQRLIRRMMIYIKKLHHDPSLDAEEPEDQFGMLRFKRIPFQWGVANWEFIGKGHVRACH